MIPTFVVGTGRCGSTLLSELLGTHAEVLSLSEFFSSLGGPAVLNRGEMGPEEFFPILFNIGDDLAEQLSAGPIPEVLRPIDGDRSCAAPLMLTTLPLLVSSPEILHSELQRLVRSFSFGPVVKHLDGVFGFLAERLHRTRVVERSGASVEYVDLFQRHWPSANFIYIVRGGRECALSMSEHLLFRVRVARLVRRNPTLPVHEALAVFVDRSRFGAYWSALMLRMQSAIASQLPNQVFLLRYEDILVDPCQALDMLWPFLRIRKPTDSEYHAMRLLVKPRTARGIGLTAREDADLQRACRPGSRVLEALMHGANARGTR